MYGRFDTSFDIIYDMILNSYIFMHTLTVVKDNQLTLYSSYMGTYILKIHTGLDSELSIDIDVL